MQPRIENPAQSAPERWRPLCPWRRSPRQQAQRRACRRQRSIWSRPRPAGSTAAPSDSTCTADAAKKHGITDPQLHTLVAWRDSPYFDESQRAALAFTEAGTRLADRPDVVPDDVWDTAAKIFDEPALSALVLNIALINTWNRLNVMTGQVAGEWTAQYAG